jgi:gliding motility-associated-like protein
MAVSPSFVQLAPGTTVTTTVTVSSLNGFTQAVALTLTNLPTGVTAIFTPTTVTGSATSTLTLTADATAPLATTSLTITGTAGTLSHSTTLDLEVTTAVTEPVAVTSFSLINTTTGEPIPGFDPIAQGALIDLTLLPTRTLAIRATTTPPTVSVSFDWDGSPNLTSDNMAPFTFTGPTQTMDWTPTLGEHQLAATPFGTDATTGTALSLAFTVIESVQLQPPLLFSPNEDGVNDYWEITGIEAFPDYQVTIFDRYGTKVYEAKPYSSPWNGTFQGKPLAQGAYFYIIGHQSTSNLYTGSITLIR